jgi:RNase adaptor protein for sRNA GlmZ degradation|tara:strand:+ start:21632 stop:22054 length:423 start_codon:yes stop_codon:yes gene_type:complete
MTLPVISQNISKGEIKTTVSDSGDTLVIMNLEDAKFILSDLLEYEVTDSLLNIYIERDSLNKEVVLLKDSIIEKINQQNDNCDEIVVNLKNMITNNKKVIELKDDTINQQKKEIKKQKFFKFLGFAGSIILPIVTLITLL